MKVILIIIICLILGVPSATALPTQPKTFETPFMDDDAPVKPTEDYLSCEDTLPIIVVTQQYMDKIKKSLREESDRYRKVVLYITFEYLRDLQTAMARFRFDNCREA